MADIKTQEITWDDVKVSDHIVVEQIVKTKGPRVHYRLVWVGKVTEHSQKWTRLKHQGVDMSIVTKYGEETITRVGARDFKKYIKSIGLET